MQNSLKSKLPEVGTTIFTVMSALANEHRAVNLSQGFPDFDCDDKLKSLVDSHIRQGYNQYAPMAGIIELREVLSEKIYRQHGQSYHPDSEVTITAGATQAIFTAITALVHPGDEVIILEPAYDCYAPAISLAGGVTVRVSLDIEHGDLPVNALMQALSPRTRLLIINSPHNPTGMCFSAEAMQELEKLLQPSDVMILSDEVYEHILFDGRVHESVARYPGLAERSILISSFGKTYHNTGWKLGYCMAPSAIMAEFRKVHQFNVFCVNRPMQHAFAEFMKEGHIGQELSALYQKKRDLFCTALSTSRFKFTPAAGTYFQVLDYSPIDTRDDMVIATEWTKDRAIASIPISAFYHTAPHQHLLRFCFAKSEETILKAGEILAAL